MSIFLQGTFIGVLFLAFLIFLWRRVGNRRFFKLFGIAFLVMLFLIVTPTALMGPGENNTPQLKNQIEILQQIYLVFIFAPNLLYLFKLLKNNFIKSPVDELRVEIIPFYSLQKAINKKYPQEKILQTKWGLEQMKVWWWLKNSPLLPGAETIPMSLNSMLNINIPAKIVETKNSYFVDRRIPSLITFLLISAALSYWLSKNLESSNSTYYILLFIGVELFLYLFYIAFWQLGMIQVLKKEWIKNSQKWGPMYTFVGTIPNNTPVTLSENQVFNTKVSAPFVKKFIMF